MFWLLTLSTYALGGWLGWLALRWYLRRRVSATATSRLGGVGVATASTLSLAALLVPEVPALLVLQEQATMAGSDAMWLLRWLAVTTIVLVVLALVFTSRFVIAAARELADRIVSRLPSWEGQRARRRFRRRIENDDAGLAVFPDEWEELLAYDQVLSRRLLAYDHDLELSVSYPVMHDYTEPQTRAALDAMFECDRLRTGSAPWLTRDVIVTPYGVAVARFAEQLVIAEAHAVEQARIGLSEQERAGLAEAVSILQYVQTHCTTAPEREAAYRHVHELLDGQPEGVPSGSDRASGAGSATIGSTYPGLDLDLGEPVSPTVRSQPHPWLDVPQRAALHRPG